MSTLESRVVRGKVAEYYGRVLKSRKDLKTSACCSLEKLPAYVQEPLKLIEDEIQNKYYGCGTPFPFVIKGMKVLDLGCGTGRDCFVLSCLAGQEGEVVGVDMTDEQLEIANRYLPVQMRKFGYARPNTAFKKGYIEDLRGIGLPDNHFDIVVSNCVVNLSPDKDAVLREVYRVLKKGGEFFFSDVYCDRRLPAWAKEDPVLLGECLGGALYWKDFERLAKKAGFRDPRVFVSSKIGLFDPETIAKVGFANFQSRTYRLFKIPELEDACEDYGQTAVYQGTVQETPFRFILDDHHVFEAGKPMLVCANTADMLLKTRFRDHFQVAGDLSRHFGLFKACGNPSLADTESPSQGGCC
ncbi:MAG: methyltransferase domain-containing protein [Candidatus Omnitrophota bacterium]|nr:methyltransferase domain-containing protein [Candidatus Omnitrophota bacterium]MDZ4241784.1 methyltransferase domain-containing protein [Candidatus Omnitrophota bacterium]